MITQKILFNKETVKRQLPLNFDNKDITLFRNELKRTLRKSYLFHLKNVKIFPDGSIYPLNIKIIDNQLGFISISSFKFLKQIFLLIIFSKNIFCNILNYIFVIEGFVNDLPNQFPLKDYLLDFLPHTLTPLNLIFSHLQPTIQYEYSNYDSAIYGKFYICFYPGNHNLHVQ